MTLKEEVTDSEDNKESRSQKATLKITRGENIKYLPYSFTENGIAMLSSVLKSSTAIQVNIHIMRAIGHQVGDLLGITSKSQQVVGQLEMPISSTSSRE